MIAENQTRDFDESGEENEDNDAINEEANDNFSSASGKVLSGRPDSLEVFDKEVKMDVTISSPLDLRDTPLSMAQKSLSVQAPNIHHAATVKVQNQKEAVDVIPEEDVPGAA